MESRMAAIFIGNSIFGDDRIGLVVGDMLKERLEELGLDVHIVERTGLALLDCLEGYGSAVIVDSICTGRNRVGEVLSLSIGDFGSVQVAVPHFSGLPEAVQLMAELKMKVPTISILGINVRDPYTLSEDMSEELKGLTGTIAAGVYERISAQTRRTVPG